MSAKKQLARKQVDAPDLQQLAPYMLSKVMEAVSLLDVTVRSLDYQAIADSEQTTLKHALDVLWEVHDAMIAGGAA